jgi:hypothetical protein
LGGVSFLFLLIVGILRRRIVGILIAIMKYKIADTCRSFQTLLLYGMLTLFESEENAWLFERPMCGREWWFGHFVRLSYVTEIEDHLEARIRRLWLLLFLSEFTWAVLRSPLFIF